MPPPPPGHGGGMPSPHLAGPPQAGGMPPHGGPPPEHQALPPPPPPAPAAPPAAEQQHHHQQQEQHPAPTSKKFSLSGGSVRLQLNRDYYRTPPGMMGILEVLCSCAIVVALSLRGFIFDVFFFLCNLGFTYTLVGAMFFVNGLLGSRAGRDLPLLVAVQYYGLGFIMFLAAGIASLVKSQRDILAILVGTLAVVVAIAHFVHAVYSVRTS